MNLRSVNEKELFEGYAHELRHLEGKGMTVRLVLSPVQAMALVGALQLALRHPDVKSGVRLAVEMIVAWVQSEFLQYAASHVQEVIRRGGLEEFDEVRKEP